MNENILSRKFIIITVIVVFIVVPLAAWIIVGQLSTNRSNNAQSTKVAVVPARSNTELLDAITSNDPSLLDSTGKPTIAIVKVVRMHDIWYIVTIAQASDTANTAKVLINDSYPASPGLAVLAGPGTNFDQKSISGTGAPADVLQELNS